MRRRTTDTQTGSPKEETTQATFSCMKSSILVFRLTTALIRISVLILAGIKYTRNRLYTQFASLGLVGAVLFRQKRRCQASLEMVSARPLTRASKLPAGTVQLRPQRAIATEEA